MLKHNSWRKKKQWGWLHLLRNIQRVRDLLQDRKWEKNSWKEFEQLGGENKGEKHLTPLHILAAQPLGLRRPKWFGSPQSSLLQAPTKVMKGTGHLPPSCASSGETRVGRVYLLWSLCLWQWLATPDAHP